MSTATPPIPTTSKRADLCPACQTFVRFDWTDTCQNCGASILIAAPDPISVIPERATRKSKQQLNVALLLAAVLIAGSVSVGGVLVANNMSSASDGKATSALPPPSSPADHIRFAAATMDDLKSFTVVSETSANGQTVAETITWNGDSGLMKSTSDAFEFPMEVVVDTKRSKAYSKLAETKRVEASKPWAEIVDPETIPAVAGSDYGFASIASGARNVQDMGQMLTDGRAATRYVFDIDRDAVLSDPKSQSGVTDAIRALGNANIYGEMWVDDDHRVVWSTLVVSKPDVRSAGFTVNQTFRNFDSAEKVTLPKKSEISKQTVHLSDVVGASA